MPRKEKSRGIVDDDDVFDTASNAMVRKQVATTCRAPQRRRRLRRRRRQGEGDGDGAEEVLALKGPDSASSSALTVRTAVDETWAKAAAVQEQAVAAAAAGAARPTRRRSRRRRRAACPRGARAAAEGRGRGGAHARVGRGDRREGPRGQGVALEAQPTELREELRKARARSRERLLKEARDEARAAASNRG